MRCARTHHQAGGARKGVVLVVGRQHRRPISPPRSPHTGTTPRPLRRQLVQPVPGWSDFGPGAVWASSPWKAVARESPRALDTSRPRRVNVATDQQHHHHRPDDFVAAIAMLERLTAHRWNANKLIRAPTSTGCGNTPNDHRRESTRLPPPNLRGVGPRSSTACERPLVCFSNLAHNDRTASSFSSGIFNRY